MTTAPHLLLPESYAVAPDRPLGVHAKVAEIRKARLEVERTRDEKSAVSWGDADDVAAVLYPLLELHDLVVEPEVAESRVTPAGSKMLALVRLPIRLVDTAADAHAPDGVLVSEWACEAWLDPDDAGGIAGAITSGLKGWCVHTFAIRLVDSERAKVRTVTPNQIKNFIGQAQKEAGLSGDQVLAIANELVDDPIAGLATFPAHLADDLVDRIKAVGASERAKARANGGGA